MKNNNEMSLVALLRKDTVIVDRIKEGIKEVKKDKSKITKIANTYNLKYEKEIIDGTRKRNLLISEGVKRGKPIEEVEREIGFIPSIYTPILNWLHFFMKEGRNPKKEFQREEQDELNRLLLHEQQEVVAMKKVPEMFVYLSGKVTHEQFNRLKKLKRLSKSPNEHEAFQAYRTCLKYCNDYGVDFDEIPG